MGASAAGLRYATPCDSGPHPAWFLTKAINQREVVYTKLLTGPTSFQRQALDTPYINHRVARMLNDLLI